MKELLIANCQKSFLLKCLEEHTRLDGRAFDEFRELKIDFGKDWGCCHVTLGQTRVLAQVSCEVQIPKSSRPNEGLMNINVELNPMGAPQFEPGRQSELSVHLNRLLEKCLKDSKAIDLESLCIKLAEKVWALRIDVNVLNHDGNILDCASIAALTALAHFRRPDVTCDGETVTIHTYKERDPIPTVVHHYPVCVTYAIFNQSSVTVVDPSLLEESVSETQLVLAINSFREICSIHLGGSALVNQQLILQCTSKAAKRAFDVVTLIKKLIEEDYEERKENKKVFFQHYLLKENEEISTEQLSAILNKWNVKKSERKKKRIETEKERTDVDIDTDKAKDLIDKSVILLGEGSAGLLSKKDEEQMISSGDESDDSVKIIEQQLPEKIIIDSDDNSEEETITLHSEMTKDKKPNNTPQSKKNKRKISKQ